MLAGLSQCCILRMPPDFCATAGPPAKASIATAAAAQIAFPPVMSPPLRVPCFARVLAVEHYYILTAPPHRKSRLARRELG